MREWMDELCRDKGREKRDGHCSARAGHLFPPSVCCRPEDLLPLTNTGEQAFLGVSWSGPVFFAPLFHLRGGIVVNWVFCFFLALLAPTPSILPLALLFPFIHYTPAFQPPAPAQQCFRGNCSPAAIPALQQTFFLEYGMCHIGLSS